MKTLSTILTVAICLCATACTQSNDNVDNAVIDYTPNAFYYQRNSLFELLPTGPDDIIFIGNSLTNGCEWSELLSNPNVKNRGISADVLAGVIDRIDTIAAGHPAKIFIQCGINDVSHNLSPDSIGKSMEQLIVRIKEISPTTRIYLQSLLPVNTDFHVYTRLAEKEGVILECNRIYKEIAERQHVTWIDLFSELSNEKGQLMPEITNDGLHLLGQGYVIWRNTVAPYVAE